MRLVFATNNANKLKEIQSLIPNKIKLLSLQDIGCFEDIPETQETIEGNAKQKADYIKSHYGYDCFADDTGLEVISLNNQPGIFSARYAGIQRNSEDNMRLLLENLKGQPNREAQFKTIIALNIDQHQYQFSGICKGTITLKKKGNYGFDYDHIFKPLNFNQTFAEMDLNLKNSIGHRGKAVQALVSFLNSKILNK